MRSPGRGTAVWMLCATVACGLAALAVAPAPPADATPSDEASRVVAMKGFLRATAAGRRVVTVRVAAEHPRPHRRGKRVTVRARVLVVNRKGRVLARGRTSQTRALPAEGPNRLRQTHDLALSPRASRAVRRAAARPRTRVRVVASVTGAAATATAVQGDLALQQTDGRLAYAADMGPQPHPPGAIWSLNTMTGETTQATAPSGIAPNQVIVGLQDELLVASNLGVFESPEFGAPTWTPLIPPFSDPNCGNPQIALSPDGRYVAATTPGCDANVYVYDLQADQLHTVDNPDHDIAFSVAFSGDGESVYAVYHAGGLINWRLAQWSLSSIVSGNPTRNTYDLGTAPHSMGPIAVLGSEIVMAESDNKLYVAPQDLSSQNQIEVVDFGGTVNVDPGWLSTTPPQPGTGQYLYIGGNQPNLGCYDGQTVSECPNPTDQATGAGVMVPGSTTGAAGVPPASGLIIAGDVGGEGGTAIYQIGTTGAATTPIRELTGFFEAAGVGITPHASPTISLATPQVDNFTVELDASQSVSDDGSALTYSWDFGDGTTGTGAQVLHTYQQAGAYQVTLTVDDGENCPAGVVSDGMNILCAGPSQVSQQVQVQTTAPAFAASPDPVDFGNVWANESWTETVTVTNGGSGTLQIGQVTTSGAPFTVGEDDCSNGSVAPNGGTCTLQVTFAPTAAQSYPGELSVPTNVPGQATQTVALSGTGIEPGFAVTPDPVELGDVWANESRTETVTVTNTGNGELDVGQIVSGGAPFTVSDDECSNRSVAPNGGTCTLRVRFAPTAEQHYRGQLHFPFNSPDIQPKTLQLAGTGVEPGFSASPNPVAFGPVPLGETRSEQVRVTNTGNGNLNVDEIEAGGAPFAVSDDECSNRPVPPDGNCTLRVTFSPTAAQDYQGQLTFSFTSPDVTPKALALSGAGFSSIGPLIPPALPTAKLAITNSVNHGRGTVGRPLTYTVVVTNRGPSTATGVEVTDELSVPGRVVSVTSNAGEVASLMSGAATCTKRLPLRCSLGAIPAGGKVTVKIVLIPKAPGRVRNTAAVTALAIDPETANNVDAVTVSIAKPALGLVMRADRRSVEAGQAIKYTIGVRNPTGVALRHVRTCDNLPAGLVYVSSKTRAKLLEGRRCWTLRRLGAHEKVRYTLTARALNGVRGRRTNRVSAASPDARSVHARRTVNVTPGEAKGGGVTG